MKHFFIIILLAFNTVLAMAQETILSPFFIKTEELKALALVNIEKDPDSVYIGFEPQLLKNEHGEGMLIIGYRADGKTDIYFQPQLQLKASDYESLGKGVHKMKVVPLKNAYLRFSEKGLHLYAFFADIFGREILLKVDEKNKAATKPFGLLAPVGTNSDNPTGLMLVFLEDFYFVRQTNTEVEIQIGDKKHKMDHFMPMDGKKMYFSRYTPRPITVIVNPDFSGIMETLPIIGGKAQHKGSQYNIIFNSDKPEIESIEKELLGQTIKMSFSPSFPDVRNVRNGEKRNGSFSLVANEKTGTVSGKYSVHNENGTVHLTLIPSGGWKPYPKNRFVVKMVFSIATVFRQWPKTYEWHATIKPTADNRYEINTEWKRNTNK